MMHRDPPRFPVAENTIDLPGRIDRISERNPGKCGILWGFPVRITGKIICHTPYREGRTVQGFGPLVDC